VIEAIAHLNTTLVIVGGLSNSQNELLNRNNIDYEVHVGISKEALLREYERCDILSFVSTYEGFGMPIIESQAVGRPVLTSELEPMKSVAGNGALLVDPYSVDSIRRGFERLLEETEIRSRLIREGFENVKRFSIESVSKQYLNLYKKLAN
jgi:glycosyltransferase involved in cell wall biosynthesis